MRLPTSVFKKKGDEHFYLALLLRDESVTAVIFEEQDGKISYVTSHEETVTTSIEHADIEEWLDTFDKAVSIAESKIHQETNLEKTIFGVKETWITDGKIKKEYLAKLKKVCDELSLSPIGFLVFSEAAMHLLQQQEGAPISAVFAEVGDKTLTVSLVKGGKVVESKTAKLETYNSAQIMDSLLKHFVGFEVFPPRIIVQNDSHESSNEELQHQFSKHNWSKTLPFLHLPQIIVLPKQFPTQAILAGAATQMGFQLADVPAKPHITAAHEEEPKEVLAAKQDEDSKEIPSEGDNFIPIDTQDFGFVHETDIAEKEELEVEEEPTPVIKEHNASEEELEAVEDTEVTKNKRLSLPLQSFMLASTIKSFVTKLPVKKTLFKVPMRGGKLVFLIPIIFIVLIAALGYYFYSVKTTVSLAIHPNVITQSQDITFTTKGDNDFSNNIIAAEAVSVTENGSVQTQATGKKDIGDKAKGTITIYNSSDTSKSFSTGTAITSDKGLKYTIDKDVTVASGSGDPIAPKSGTAQVSVTASDIGTDYNLPSSSTFSIAGESSSTVKAKNDSAFSGGSKKTVTVVSKDDIAKLSSQLVKNIQGTAKDDVSKKLSSNQELLSAITASDVSNKKTNKNVGDQATTITMTGNVSFEALAYKKDDITAYAKQLLANKVLANQTLDEGSIMVNVTNASSQKNGSVTAAAELKANVLPKLDTAQIAKEVAGKSFDDATQILNKLPQVSGSTITLSPNIVLLPKRVSIQSSNITIVTHNE